jgi:nucleoid-associated protein YgaU
MAKAKLVCKLPVPGGSFSFDYNPDKITMRRNTSGRNANTQGPGGGSPTIAKKTKNPQITINKIILDGPHVKDTCEMLMDWMTPGGGFVGRMIGAVVSFATGGFLNLATRPPELNFSWGSGFDVDCTLQRCNVNYTRFDDDGNPIRADLSLTLEETPDTILDLLPTNPTSGGAPGRRSHLVTAGESLPMLSLRSYGNPRYWRAVADTNGIDDPFRVRPGRHLYLPNPDELIEGS